jgi:predicted permease
MSWLKGLFARMRMFGDLSEEIREHLDEKVEELVEAGMPRKQAEQAARREFGNVTLIERDGRDVWKWVWMENLSSDLRFASRMLRRSPAFTLTAIIVLGLGLCVNVAIFAFVDAALLQPLPYRDPSRLVGVYETVQMIPHSDLSYYDYLDWRRLNRVFSSLDVYGGGSKLMNTPSGTVFVYGGRVSDGFFRTLGVSPILGRDFYQGEDLPSAAAAVILSYGAWQRWFGGRRDVIGQTISFSDAPYTVIGVLPQDFHFAPRGSAEFWTTLREQQSCEKSRSCHNLYGVARLKDGVTVQVAQEEMQSIAGRLEAQYPDSNRGQGAAVVLLSDAIVGVLRPTLVVLLAGAGLLLLIATVNVANLMLVRSESRRRELAVRVALGASTARLFVQFATEGVLVAVAAATLGGFAAQWAMHLLLGLVPADLLASTPFLLGLGMHFRVIAFECVLAVTVATLFSVAPIMRLSIQDLRGGLAEGRSSGNMWRRLGSKLVVAELAIAVVLLVAAGLLGKSLYKLLRVELGFHADHLVTLDVAAPENRYREDGQQRALGRLVISRIEALPGVVSAGTSNRLPLEGNGNTHWIRFVGRPYSGEHNEVNGREVSAGFFTTLQATLLRGRFFTDAEDASKPQVAIINEALAKQYFLGEDPIGKKVGDSDLSEKSLREIVGVVENVKEGALDEPIWPTIYIPFNQRPLSDLSLVVRTSQSEEAMLPTLVATIREIDGSLGTLSGSTMNRRMNESPTAYLHRLSAWLVGGFASLALLLSVVGLYGAVAYSVGQRTREIGVRMALGAQRGSVYELILGEAGQLAAGGIAAGLVCGVGAAALMRGVLFGVVSWDVTTLGAVAVTLGIFAMLASYIPARRAAGVDPVVALRHE